jgi:hypothetical protein
VATSIGFRGSGVRGQGLGRRNLEIFNFQSTTLGKPKDFPKPDNFFPKLVRAKNSFDKIIMKI